MVRQRRLLLELCPAWTCQCCKTKAEFHSGFLPNSSSGASSISLAFWFCSSEKDQHNLNSLAMSTVASENTPEMQEDLHAISVGNGRIVVE